MSSVKNPQLVQTVTNSINKALPRIYHSQPMPRHYSDIAKAHRLIDVSPMQLAFVDAVVAAKVH